MFKKNEDGAALVLVLFLLLIGTILVGTIITTARNHINIAVHEEGMSKAFHNAESGVEFVRGNKDYILDNIEDEDNYYLTFDKEAQVDKVKINKYENIDDIKTITDDDLDISNAKDLEFEITINKNNSKYQVKSKGFYNSNSDKIYKQEIKFDIVYSFGNANKTFNLEADIEGSKPTESEKDSLLNSQAQVLFPTFISIKSEIEPSLNAWNDIRYDDDTEEWNGDSSLSEQIVNFSNNNNKLKNAVLIKNSIIFVDGDLEINPHIEWENSIIIIDGTLKFNGTPNSSLLNSMFFIYNKDDEDKNVLHPAGNIDFDEWNLDLDFEKLDFEKLPINFNEENSGILEKNITNWSQL